MRNAIPITDINELKEIELNIMLSFHEFTEEFGLKYYLAYGTLIGAVRHKGFIPWDDDIDVMMMRADYDVFLKKFPEWATNRDIFLASPFQKDHYYPYEAAKVCSSDTYISELMLRIDSNLGVFIDVFPVDALPDNPLKKRIVYKLGRLLRRLMVAGNTNCKSDEFISHYSKVKRIFIRAFNVIPIRWSFALMDKLVHSIASNQTKEVMCFASTFGTVLKRNWFDKPIQLEFENKLLFAPSGYDEMLRTIYGDYMKLPKEEDRIPHHVMSTFRYK